MSKNADILCNCADKDQHKPNVVASKEFTPFKQPMIADTLISDDVWSEAPEEADEAFLFISLSANKLLRSLEDDEQARGQHTFAAWRQQYIYELSTVAEQLGISGLPAAANAVQGAAAMSDFDAQLARILTKIRATRRDTLRVDSVALSYKTKADLRDHIEELRAAINASNLSESARATLHKKVDAVEAELDKSRASLRPFWTLAGAVALTGLGVLSDLSGAVETVNKVVELVHNDKTIEEQSDSRFIQPQISGKPALQITHQPKPKAKKSKV